MTERNKEILSSLKYQQIGIDWVGKTKNIFFKLQEDESTTNLVIIISLASSDSRGDIIEFLDKTKSNHEISDYQIVSDAIIITCSNNTNTDNVKDLLSKIADKCVSANIHNVCENCERTSFLDFYTNQFKSILLCSDCFKLFEQKINDSKNTPNNYVRGFLASLIGAIIGSVVWIGIGALGFYASIAGYAISLSSFRGYEIAKGKKTSIGIGINIITILIALVFAQYVGIYIDILKEYPEANFLQYISATPALFSDIGFIKEILPNMAIGLVFAVFGSFRTIKSNYQHANFNDKVNLEKVVL